MQLAVQFNPRKRITKCNKFFRLAEDKRAMSSIRLFVPLIEQCLLLSSSNVSRAYIFNSNFHRFKNLNLYYMHFHTLSWQVFIVSLKFKDRHTCGFCIQFDGSVCVGSR